jgi:hypothetical protein
MHVSFRNACFPRRLLNRLKNLRHLKFCVSQTNSWTSDDAFLIHYGLRYQMDLKHKLMVPVSADKPFLPFLESLHIWAVTDECWRDEIVGMTELRSLCIERVGGKAGRSLNPDVVASNIIDSLDLEGKPYLRYCKFGALISDCPAFGAQLPSPVLTQTDSASAITADIQLLKFARHLPHCVIETNWKTHDKKEYGNTTQRTRATRSGGAR